jgi:hypothetical protein
MEILLKQAKKFAVEKFLVQILVVVVIIQMRTLKTEVGKVSMLTVVGHGSVVPNLLDNSIKK